MMTRFFYILLLLLISCSGNNPIRYIKPVETAVNNSFFIEYGTLPHDSFPLHYSKETESPKDSDIISYSFIVNEGDTAIWEEVVIRHP